MLHILFDSWNSYGIHPFYPFNNKWFYGDLVFIVEPFLWFAFAAPLFFIFHSKWTRFTLIGVIATVPLLAAYNGLLTWYSVAATFSFALITSFFAQRAKTVSRKILAGVTAAILFLATQSFTAMKVREQLNASFEPQSPKHKIIDPVLSALPANPFCWSVIQLEVDQANDKYITISKIVSSWPTLLAAESCPVFRAPAGRAEMELSEFVAITEKDCYVDAWLRFSRAPFFENSLASDLRFAQRQISNFSNLEISSDKRYCPRFIPPWSRPRQDILDAPIRGQAKTNP